MQHYQIGNASVAQFCTHMHRKLCSSSTSCFLLYLRLVSNLLIIKCLHEIFSQMFQRWQSMTKMFQKWQRWQNIQEFWDHVQKDTRKRSWLQRASAFPWVKNWQENNTLNCWKDAPWQHHTVMWSAAHSEIWLWTPPPTTLHHSSDTRDKW